MNLLRELTKEKLPLIPPIEDPVLRQYFQDLHSYLERVKNVFTEENISLSISSSKTITPIGAWYQVGAGDSYVYDFCGEQPFLLQDNGAGYYLSITFFVSFPGTYTFRMFYGFDDSVVVSNSAIYVRRHVLDWSEEGVSHADVSLYSNESITLGPCTGDASVTKYLTWTDFNQDIEAPFPCLITVKWANCGATIGGKLMVVRGAYLINNQEEF